MDISGTDIPIDDHLREALDDKEREVVDEFFDFEGAARLEKLGLIQSSEHHADVLEQIKTLQASLAQQKDAESKTARQIQDDLAALQKTALVPVFDLGGKANIKVHLTQAYGPHTPHVVTVHIDASRVSILTKAWNYPIKIVQGSLVISPDGAQLENIHVQGLTGVKGTLTGNVTLPDKDVPGEQANPDVHFAGSDLPLDSLLLASIPPAQAQLLQQLDAHGRLTLTGKVYRTADPQNPDKSNHNGPMDFDIHAQIQEETDPQKQSHARPFDGRITLGPLSGKILIHRQSARIESLASAFGEAKVALTGNVAWQDKNTSLDLDISATHVNFNQPVLDLVPSHSPAMESLRHELETYKPSGFYDASVALKIQGDDEPDYLVKINPHSLALINHKQPAIFTRTQGQVRIEPKQIVLDHMLAWFDQASTLSCDGHITLGEQPRVDVTLGATGRRLDTTTLALLPDGLRTLVDSLELAGGYQLRNASLVYQPKAKDRLAFKGQLRLIDAKADLGVPIENLQGVMNVQASLKADEEWPRVKVDLQATRLKAQGRLIEQLQTSVESADEPGLLMIPNIQAHIYHGQLLGQGQVQLGDKPQYSLRLTVENAALAAVVEPDKWQTQPPHDPMDGTTYASLSASLSLQGTPDDVASRQGRGRIDVRQANLYQTPIAMALLQILNLTLPTASSFDRASASYIIDGDLVRFDTIRLETPSLALTGKGAMTFTTQKLDLDFVTRNTAGPHLGPLGDLVSVLKDQIVAIHVGGTLEKPVTSVKSFSGIGRTWNDLFSGQEHTSSEDEGGLQ
jgi:hypothetical protein